MSNDESLGDKQDATDALDEYIDDESTLPAPEDYDFAAMVAGVRPTRARVRIRPASHLLARLEELAEQVDALPADDDLPDDLADEWEQTKAAYDRTFVVVVEGRSSDWVKEFAREAKSRGINPQRKGLSDEARFEQTKKLMMAQLAAQVVHPTQGVTEESVAALFAANETEGDKLWRAMQRVNTQPAGDGPDFSRRPSQRSRRG